MRALLCLSALVLATGCEGAGFTSLSPPNLVVNVDALDFGEIPIGFTVSKKVTLLNSGEVVLNVRAIRVEVGGPFAVTNPVTTIAAGKDAEITVTFSPTVARGYQGTLVIESDASNTTSKSVPLSGAGMAVNTCGDCNMPPVAACLTPSDRVSYASTGSCMMGMCQYTASVEVCTNGCERAMCKGVVAADAGPLADAAGDRDAGPNPDAAAMVNADAAAMVNADAAVLPNGQVFETPGVQTFVVPMGVTEILVRAWGGGGQGGNQNGATGGGAGFVTARVVVTPGETLDIAVAEGGGFNPSAQLGDGGGASYVSRGATDLVIAAGGGGGGSDGNSGNSMSGGRGGAGGGLRGEDGQNGIGTIAPYCLAVTGGNGGDQTIGGAGGTSNGTGQYRCTGVAGVRDIGGRASGTMMCDVSPGASRWRSGGGQANGGGGGGGAGYFGGGGSGFIWTYCAGGGGGGSSFADMALTAVTHEAGIGPVAGLEAASMGAGKGGDRCQGPRNMCQGNSGGNGRVEISY